MTVQQYGSAVAIQPNAIETEKTSRRRFRTKERFALGTKKPGPAEKRTKFAIEGTLLLAPQSAPVNRLPAVAPGHTDVTIAAVTKAPRRLLPPPWTL